MAHLGDDNQYLSRGIIATTPRNITSSQDAPWRIPQEIRLGASGACAPMRPIVIMDTRGGRAESLAGNRRFGACVAEK